MLKRNEIAVPTSCLNNAADDEPIFVLKSTDELAPGIVRAWAGQYWVAKIHEHGELTQRQQAKYEEALALADQMDHWRQSREDKSV